MKNNIIKDKSFLFAVQIVEICKVLIEEKREYILSKQLMRSGTAIGALIRESEQAESKADFIHKLSIALKEANETEYWIDLLKKTGYLDQNKIESVMKGQEEILKLLVSIIKTSKKNNG